jgi:fatty-acyl-CoA synthase
MNPNDSWRFPADRVLGGHLPPAARRIGELISEISGRQPDGQAIAFGGRGWTYRQLDDITDALAGGLLARGLRKGDHVALLMGNRPEWIFAWIAANKMGAVAVGVSTWSSAAELEYMLKHSDARMLIYSDRVGPRNLDAVVDECLAAAGWRPAAKRSARLPCLDLIHRIDAGADPDIAYAGMPATGIDKEMLAAIQAEIRRADVALLLYTSGSTSTPKGVQLVHGILIEHGYDIGEGEDMRATDRFWLSLPLCWSAGSANSAMATLTHGATIVLQEYFDAKTAAALLVDERCTHYFAFPNVTRAIHQELAGARLPAARVAVTSGQPETLRQLQAMGFSKLLHTYGTSEDYGFATINGPDETFESLSWSQGRALPGIELVVADPQSGQPCAPGVPGEILLRGNVTVGYYKDEDKNRTAFDDRGYFHTGDTGIEHPDGRLQFLGRNSEMIKTAGFNVSPAEVEAALLKHPGVADAHVVGVPDAERGQVAVACVKFSAAAVSLDALKAQCTTVLSGYKVPKLILPMETFPLTATGKVSKLALRQMAEAEWSKRAAARD